ncbi:glycosyltransferase [Gulosibacter molinativorax]|uniref:glycosyltransferase n=1 Tax=Gulosibacter molinativorax TaxID=256821 RepID=UPI0004281D47|nr:glycosyltransferase [Gulosibacter molinativorax]QUY63471.1 D-inositol-3-phosphate glycosyltransferase [Gulosibacter molinativorax]
MTLADHGASTLRIAFVVLHTSPIDEPGTKDAGGMNVVVRAQAEELAKLGHRVELITRRQDPDSPAFRELAPNLSLHILDAGPAETLEKGDHELYIGEFRDALEPLLRSLKVDIVHAEHWFSGIAALPITRALGVPLVQSFHSIAAKDASPLTDGERAESPGRLEGEAMLAKEADSLVVISNAERETAVSRLGAEPDRVEVVSPGVDHELFHPGPAKPEGHRKRLIAAGRLHPLKGFDLAIEALALIEPEIRPELVIVGAAAPDTAEYEESLHVSAARLGVEDDVQFVGAKTRGPLADELRASDIALMTSHSETFGLVSLEAAATGLPVVAYRSGGLQESVLDGDTGILVDSREPADWAATITRLVTDDALAEQLGEGALAHALEMSWQASAQRLLEVYRGIERPAPEPALKAALNRAEATMTGSIQSVLEGAKRILVVHAHPDDEALAGGALLRALHERGTRVALLTCCRGEAGEIVAGVLPEGTDAAELSRVRERELAGSVSALGIAAAYWLGMPPARADGLAPRVYRDSGMRWIRPGLAGPADATDLESLTAASLEDVTADVRALAEAEAPDLIISYDDDGGYGHPDHVRTREATLAAARELDIPFAELIEEEASDEDSVDFDGDDAAWFSLPEHLPAVLAALRSHRTQLTVDEDGRGLTHSGGQRQEVPFAIGLRLVPTAE